MFELYVNTGRLAEVRFAGVISDDDMATCIQTVRSLVTKNLDAGLQTLCVTDMREMISVSDGAIDALVWLLRRDNPAKTVNAFFVNKSDRRAQAQVARLIDQATSPLRRLFSDEETLLEWLAPMLTPEEHAQGLRYLRRSINRHVVASR